ncbi:MAG: serine/threonine protein kinase [Myxococcota bacterium]|nr:serine/threonine protein kinase [Myxococcota bacterium]
MVRVATRSDVPPLAGALIAGKYRVLRVLGGGGMGTVWEAVHVTLATRVAIKFIRPRFAGQAEARARFEIEARAAARLQTKHAVQVYDYGLSDDGLPYIVMEFLEGESLADAIVARGRLPSREVALIIGQAARALTLAHAAGVVHRDLKPDNIFLARSADAAEGLPYVVKLVDFGIAKMFEDGSEIGPPLRAMGGPTRDGTVIGTPNFMAPEQLVGGGSPGPLTDLWSLGACAFAAMTGRLPFEGDVLGDIVLRVCAAPLPVPSQVDRSCRDSLPQGFDAWFARACSRDPTKRFQTAEKLAQTLRDLCGLAGVRTGTLGEDRVQYVMRRREPALDGSDIPIPPSMSPRTALLAGLVLGIAAMVGVLGFVAWRQHAAPAAAESAPPVSSEGRAAHGSPSGPR